MYVLKIIQDTYLLCEYVSIWV